MNLNIVQHICAMNVLHAYMFPDAHLLSCREATEKSCFHWRILQSFYQRAILKIGFFSPSGVVKLRIKAHKTHKIVTLFLLDRYEKIVSNVCRADLGWNSLYLVIK